MESFLPNCLSSTTGSESRILYITTGLIKYIPSYEALVGVLAHELGHIVNYHITKRMDSINSLKTLNKFSYLSFITSSVLSKNADLLLQSMVTNQLGIQSYYSAFSRDKEREENIYAEETLNKLHISPKPLKDFLRILEEMDEFNCVEFTIGDIVRSGFVRSYLINKIKLGIGME